MDGWHHPQARLRADGKKPTACTEQLPARVAVRRRDAADLAIDGTDKKDGSVGGFR
jgi:hypothetical protein